VDARLDSIEHCAWISGEFSPVSIEV